MHKPTILYHCGMWTIWVVEVMQMEKDMWDLSAQVEFGGNKYQSFQVHAPFQTTLILPLSSIGSLWGHYHWACKYTWKSSFEEEFLTSSQADLRQKPSHCDLPPASLGSSTCLTGILSLLHWGLPPTSGGKAQMYKQITAMGWRKTSLLRWGCCGWQIFLLFSIEVLICLEKLMLWQASPIWVLKKEKSIYLDFKQRTISCGQTFAAIFCTKRKGRIISNFIEPQNHRMPWVGRDLKDHEAPTHQPPRFIPATLVSEVLFRLWMPHPWRHSRPGWMRATNLHISYQPRLPRAPSNLALNTSRDGWGIHSLSGQPFSTSPLS